MPDPRVAPVGIMEVAALSGFSPATVSRALRGLPGVSAKTRQAVERAASSLGYSPSPWATALTTGRTNTIAVIAPWVSRWFFSAVIEGAQEVLAEHGYDLMLYPFGMDGGVDAHSLSKRVDGVLALNVPLAHRSVGALGGLGVPIVTLGSAIEGVSSVLVDNVVVGQRAAQHLIDLGHRRIAFFGDDDGEAKGFPVAVDRHRGFDMTLRAAGIEPDPALIYSSGFTINGGEAALHRCLSESSGPDRPTALFAVSDEVAIGALHAARMHDLRIPEDLSVIGVDGHDFAYLFDLTTISQPVRDQGRIAARLLLEQVNDPEHTPTAVTVGCELIRRGSTGPLRSKERSAS
ncbi:MAG TPA: LacI family DNA-binding transcriptional regulator [Microlunatus sp.]|nr:LacI family DNA-binding transcriptional regulator [Microlunatus sp.]